MLVVNASDHLVERKSEHEMAVRVRPVGNREPRLRARDETAGNQQKERAAADEEEVSVECDTPQCCVSWLVEVESAAAGALSEEPAFFNSSSSWLNQVS